MFTKGLRDQIPPWDQNSGYSHMSLLLLGLEGHFRTSGLSVVEDITKRQNPGNIIAGAWKTGTLWDAPCWPLLIFCPDLASFMLTILMCLQPHLTRPQNRLSDNPRKSVGGRTHSSV
ncbi:hypothetical protein BDW71DRAFT_32557 [Aspergillus fruticulosus]